MPRPAAAAERCECADPIVFGHTICSLGPRKYVGRHRHIWKVVQDSELGLVAVCRCSAWQPIAYGGSVPPEIGGPTWAEPMPIAVLELRERGYTYPAAWAAVSAVQWSAAVLSAS